METSLQKFLATIQVQDFPHKEELFDAIAAGRCTFISGGGSTTDATQLLRIYRVRRAHLAGIRAAHAQALASDVSWFCQNLEAALQARVVICSVDIGPSYSLGFFLDAETNKVLGCLKTVSKLDVTDEQWERLWSQE